MWVLCFIFYILRLTSWIWTDPSTDEMKFESPSEGNSYEGFNLDEHWLHDRLWHIFLGEVDQILKRFVVSRCKSILMLTPAPLIRCKWSALQFLSGGSRSSTSRLGRSEEIAQNTSSGAWNFPYSFPYWLSWYFNRKRPVPGEIFEHTHQSKSYTVSESNRLHIHIIPVFSILGWGIFSIFLHSDGQFPKVLNLNRLFLQLSRFICKLAVDFSLEKLFSFDRIIQ